MLAHYIMWGLKGGRNGDCSAGSQDPSGNGGIHVLGEKVGNDINIAAVRYDENDADESPYAPLPADSPLNSPLPPPLPALSDSELESDFEDDENISKLKKRKKTPGRKSSWSKVELSELADVICSDRAFSQEIIFTNTKNKKNSAIYEEIIKKLATRSEEREEEWTKSLVQTRNKFKDMIGFCKRKALARITESGIADIIRAKGDWFDTLFPLVQSRASANPDNAREPSYEENPASATSAASSASSASFASAGDKGNSNDAPSVPAPSSFVPTRKKARKMKKDEMLADAIKTFQEDTGSSELVKFLEQDGKDQRAHEKAIMDMQLKHQREMMGMMMSMMQGRFPTANNLNMTPGSSSSSTMNMTWPMMYYPSHQQ